MKPTMIRMDDETRRKGEEQAAALGLNLSEYIRLIINLDAATNIIKRLKESE
jgi:antitoxin component of RelBE/YafQ-DinJ toxin-antitoxin module